MFTNENIQKWFKLLNAKIEANKAYLSDLDTPIGDGDHGNNMARGMAAVLETVEPLTTSDPTELFKKTAMALIGKVGGASGPLYGTAFLEMSKQSKQTTDVIEILEAGLSGLKKRGECTIGQKTMIDVWEPAIMALKSGERDQAIMQTYVDKTAEMQAQKGRASYLGERSIGHIDPGAQSSGYLFETLLEAGVL
ncbi:MAG: dihydroxyacetone kinase subunit DhaL [Culicoidibacterales bacterium]